MDAKLLRLIRFEMDLTQKEFALLIGLKSQSPVSKMEEGTLDCEKYKSKILEVFDLYRNKQIQYHQSRIEYLKSLGYTKIEK